MKDIETPVKVKIKGTNEKKTVGIAKHKEFENIQEAVVHFDKELGEGKGAKEVLDLINAQHKAKVMNAIRTGETRGKDPLRALKSVSKTNSAIREKLAALLAEAGIEAQLGA